MNVTVGDIPEPVRWYATGERSETSGMVDGSDPEQAARQILSAISDGVVYDAVTVADVDVAAALESLTAG
jgi:hypothetical protein